jgi:hypothetical protein
MKQVYTKLLVWIVVAAIVYEGGSGITPVRKKTARTSTPTHQVRTAR